MKIVIHEDARLALRLAAERGDAETAYARAPIAADEFCSDEELLVWEADDWEEFRHDGGQA